MQPNMERKPKADIKHITDIKAGDYFFMCSDGMLEQEDMANGESLKNIFSNTVKSDEEKVRILTGATKHNKDNHTALIIHIEDVEGEIAKHEEEKTTLPEYDMAVVEDDDSIEETVSVEERISTNVIKDDSGNSLEENTQNIPVESDDKEKMFENKGDEDKTDSNKSSQSNAVVPTEKFFLIKNINLPKSKPIVSRLILRGILVAIIVAACIVGINYVPSCSEKKIPDKTELPNGKRNNPKRDDGGRRTSNSQSHTQTESQHQGQAQAVALDVANSDAAQVATGDNPQQSTGPNGNVSATIQLVQQEDVVNSDGQIVLETINQ